MQVLNCKFASTVVCRAIACQSPGTFIPLIVVVEFVPESAEQSFLQPSCITYIDAENIRQSTCSKEEVLLEICPRWSRKLKQFAAETISSLVSKAETVVVVVQASAMHGLKHPC